MPRIPPDQISYSGGTINPRAGRFDAYVRLNGIPHRARLATIERAKAWITSVVADPARPLSPLDLADAQAALRLLPAGFTLTDAARALAGSNPAASDMPLDKAVHAYLVDREPFLRGRTRASYRSTLNRFAKHAAGALCGVTPGHVSTFVTGCAGGTRNSRLRHLSAFFSWCIEQGHLGKAPLGTVKHAPRHDSEIHVLTVAQAKTLMTKAAALRPAMVPYFALATFAGIRPEELQQLPAGKIGREYIMIDGAIAKKKRRRTIPIRPNLRAWLDAYPPEGATVHYSRVQFEAVRDALGFPWHPDVCRHSFGTYLYELTHDVPEITAQMGNSPDVFVNSYRALAIPGTGKQFFSILPKSRCTPVEQKAAKEHDIAQRQHVIGKGNKSNKPGFSGENPNK